MSPFWERSARNTEVLNKTDGGLSLSLAFVSVLGEAREMGGGLEAEAPSSSLNSPLTN